MAWILAENHSSHSNARVSATGKMLLLKKAGRVESVDALT
jgi:hypothetical protein